MKPVRILLACLLLCSLLLPSAALAKTTLKLAHATWVGYGPLYIAQDKGWFAEEGLDVKLLIIDDEAQYASALAAGSIDGLCNVIDREVIHFAKGTPEVLVFAMDESAGGDGIVAAPGIDGLADLQGKDVALDKSTTSYFFFLSALERAGVSEDSMTIHEMSAGDAGAAFVAGKVDAAVTWEPWLSNAAKREGGHVLADTTDFPKTIVDILVLRKDVATAHPEAGAGLARAWYKAVEWYRAHPEEGDAIMAKAMGLKTEEMTAMAAGVRFYGQAENLEFFDRTAPENVWDVAERAVGFWSDKGIIDETVDVNALITDEYVRAAAQ
jgi:NitT/TauT family transport system substrate-binding protein